MQNNTPFKLDEIRVAAPCTADWNSMQGDERTRFCALCKKNVYNLSEMSRLDAEALIRRSEGELCTRFYRRDDGTILTDNCSVGLRAIRARMRWAMVGATAAFVAVGAFIGLRSATAAGVSIREVQPFKSLQNAQPVKAFVDWLDPVLAKRVVRRGMTMGAIAVQRTPVIQNPPIQPTPATQSTQVTPAPQNSDGKAETAK